MLSDEERQRYGRQMLLENWGEAAQVRLKSSTIFIAGAGGLGSPVAIYLAVAGIGRLRICDYDVVDGSNLNRQILHDARRIGVRKVESARATLSRLNPYVRIEALPERIDGENVDALVGDAHVIVDCLDNYEARFALNDCAIRKRIPLVFGSVYGLEGHVAFLCPPATPCLRCLFADAPPSEVFPVVGVTPGLVGSMQALMTLKYLTGVAENPVSTLLVWDGATTQWARYPIRRVATCPACGGSPKHRSAAYP